MSVNATDESSPLDPAATWEAADPHRERPGVRSSIWRGLKAGFRWTTYLIGPLAGLVLLAGLALMELGLGAGTGLMVPSLVTEALRFYLGCVIFGSVAGGLVGLIGGLVGKVMPGRSGPSWWAAANRPWRRSRCAGDTPAPGTAARPGRLRRIWPFLLGVPVQLVLLIAFGGGIYWSRYVHHRLADAVAAADRDDPYWRIDDLMAHREPVPDGENAALVVAEARELMPASWPGNPTPPRGAPSPPETEASRAYTRLGATPDNVLPDEDTAQVLRGELETYGEALQIARSLKDYDRGRHELMLGPTLIDTPLDEAQAARGVCRLLVADAAMRAAGGDADGALDSCRAMLVTARSIGDEPFLISQYVRIAIGSVAMATTNRVLALGEPSDTALARLQALVLDEMRKPLIVYGLRGERAVNTELIRRVGTGEVPISALTGDTLRSVSRTVSAQAAPLFTLWFDGQRAIGLEWMNRAVAISRRPAPERAELWAAWEADLDRVRKSQVGIFEAMLPLLLMPGLRASGAAFSRHEAELGATAILLAAERHRRKTGGWPLSIAAIDPSLLPDAPLDPFTGQPFRLEHRDGRLFIHSIGPNLRDERGAYEPRRWMQGGPDDVGATGFDVLLRRAEDS